MPVDPSVAMQLQPRLQAGERLLWAGRPQQGIRLHAIDIFLVPFSLMWGGFAIFWEAMAVTMVLKPEVTDKAGPAALIFPLFGLPFVIVGLYFIFGRFIVDKVQRQRALYAVTDQRAIIVSGILSPTVRSLSLKTLSDLSLSQRRDGSGTVTFGPTHPLARWFTGTAWLGMDWGMSPSFDWIPNAQEAYDAIRKVRSNET